MDDMMGKIQEVLSDEQSMNQIKKLAEMLGAGDMDDSTSESDDNSTPTQSPENNDSDSTSNVDMSKILMMQKILQQANKKDSTVEFLYALKPLLKDERKKKIDTLGKIFKLIAILPLIKDSGLLGGDLFDFL